MIYKTILAGRLEFGNEKTFEKVLQMFQYRVDNFYKTDLLIKEEMFDAENFYLGIPRQVSPSDDKSWNNTIKLLEYLSQFAVAGTMAMWKIDESGGKKEVSYKQIEPETDKAAVQEYLRGKKLVDETGKETEAIDALNRAIEKYEKHALAYERRGYVNFQLRNFDDALYDFSKSIDLNPGNAEPYYGRGLVKMKKEDWQGAIADFDKATQNSIPLQPIYWKARRYKGECHLKLNELQKAAQEFRFYTARTFEKGDPNYDDKKKIFFQYGKVLLELKNFAEALKAFDSAIKMESGKDIDNSELLLYRGIAAQKAGKAGFIKDWQDAAGMGSTQAAELLLTVA